MSRLFTQSRRFLHSLSTSRSGGGGRMTELSSFSEKHIIWFGSRCLASSSSNRSGGYGGGDGSLRVSQLGSLTSLSSFTNQSDMKGAQSRLGFASRGLSISSSSSGSISGGGVRMNTLGGLSFVGGSGGFGYGYGRRSYSFWGGKGNGEGNDELKVPEIPEAVKGAWEAVVDSASYVGEKVRGVGNELSPYVGEFLNANPYVKEVVVPVGWTVTGAVLAWLVLPNVLRKFHRVSLQSPVALLSGNGSSLGEQVPYEKSVWGALEDPVRYLVTFMAFFQLGVMIAPTTIASHYIAQSSRAAIILSALWFIHRWKTNIITYKLAQKDLVSIDREKLLTVDKVSSVGLILLGSMSLAEAYGVAAKSILTVSGIGGFATAYASKDILGNLLSGLNMQFSRPFSLGEFIKAGSIEGQVVEMGLTTTSLLNAEKFPVIVPNSLFSSQVIVNKSRAQWRSMDSKIPIQIKNLDIIPKITEDIKSMLKSNAKVFLGKEVPYCVLSRIEDSYAELNIGCNLIRMSKDELFTTKQDILLQAARIIKENGAELGNTQRDCAGHS